MQTFFIFRKLNSTSVSVQVHSSNICNQCKYFGLLLLDAVIKDLNFTGGLYYLIKKKRMLLCSTEQLDYSAHDQKSCGNLNVREFGRARVVVYKSVEK